MLVAATGNFAAYSINSNSIQNRSFQRRPFQPIFWLGIERSPDVWASCLGRFGYTSFYRQGVFNMWSKNWTLFLSVKNERSLRCDAMLARCTEYPAATIHYARDLGMQFAIT